jgi:tRNA (uracil-5-)-methyltransferase TRM9
LETHQVDNLKNVFDEIAPRWYNRFHWTRFMPELTELAQKWQGGRLVNIGCGHGAEFIPFKDDFELYGVDFSAGMLEQAQRYAQKFHFKVELVEADVRNLPYPDKYFDFAVSVATYHHLEGPKEITIGLKELFRVLKPGAEAFATFWNRQQPRFIFKKPELLVPWKIDDRILNRYYYLLSYKQAENIAKNAGFTLIASKSETNYRFPLKYFSKNICLLLKKPGELSDNNQNSPLNQRGS